MLDWILNPYEASTGAYAHLWIGLAVILVGSIIAAVVKMIRRKGGS